TRHAGASEVRISLQQDAAAVILEVADDGRGIADEAITSVCSLGILGMRERAALGGGELQVARVGERGTRVTLRLPRPGGLPSPAAHPSGQPPASPGSGPAGGQARAGPHSPGSTPAP